jgi:histidinol-phosphate aminotransferase
MADELELLRANQLVGLIRLDKNENAYGPSEKAIEATRTGLSLANRYPNGEYERLAEKIAGLNHVKTEQVTLGAGSREILRMAATTYLAGGKKLILASPTFDPIVHFAEMMGVEIVAIPLNKTYGHDLEAMLARADRSTGLVYVCNPNNPTGSLTPRKALEAFLEKLPSGCAVLIDEAYHHYVEGVSEYASFLDRPIDDPRLVVIRTFSKIYGLAGLRVAYAISTPRAARSLFSSQLQWGVSPIAARAAEAALDDADHVRLSAKRNTDDRQEFYNRANGLMLRSIDSHTNFVLMKTGLPSTEVIEHFKNHNVLIGPRVPQMEKYVRISLGKPEEMQEFWRVCELLPPHAMEM